MQRECSKAIDFEYVMGNSGKGVTDGAENCCENSPRQKVFGVHSWHHWILFSHGDAYCFGSGRYSMVGW